MSSLYFDKKRFNWEYAFYYTIFQRFLLVGFVASVVVVLLSAILGATFTIPDEIMPVVIIYLLVSIVGFPIISIIKKGSERLIKNSSFFCDGEILIYDRLSDNLWTAVGHVEEHHIYRILKIESVCSKRGFYIIKGNIKKEVVNNRRKLETKEVSIVKIPKAYADMERMINYGE